MKSRTLSAVAMILLTPLVVLAFQAEAEQVRKGELKEKSFTAGPLKITVLSFGYRRHIIARPEDPSRDLSYVTPIHVMVENTSDGFTTFNPRRLSFVDKANYQADVRVVINIYRGSPRQSVAEDRRIAPKASIEEWYDLTREVRLPARLYYEDKLLATIIE
jgi:hypothetical protein